VAKFTTLGAFLTNSCDFIFRYLIVFINNNELAWFSQLL